VHLQFLAERERGQFNEVDGFSAVSLDDFVGNRQRGEFPVYER